MAIITYPLNGIQYSAEDAETYLSTRTSGVFSADISITPENMTVTIGKFLAWINNRNEWDEETTVFGFVGKSVAVTEPVTLTIEQSEVVLDRIDRIVLRFDAVKNSSELIVLKGSPSSTPVPPAITRLIAEYDLCLCEIYVKAGVSQITSADIRSTILDENLCGIMRDGVTGIPTAQLEEQVVALLERLHTAISEVQSNSAFMISEVYDPSKKAKGVAFADETVPNDGSVQRVGIARNLSEISGDEDKTELSSYSSFSNGYKRSFEVMNGNREPDLNYAFRMVDKNALEEREYTIFGTHNHPVGAYAGNDSTIKRTIKIGGVGFGVIIQNDNSAMAIVTRTGAICKSINTLSALNPNEINFKDGVLTIATDNPIVNSSKYIYTCTTF